MSYPEPVYFGESGEASGIFRSVDRAPELVYLSGTAQGHYLATGSLTRGRFGLYRWEMPGPRSGPGPHFHRTMSESFYVLSGAMRLYDGTRWVDAQPGDYFFFPEGGIHGFRNESDEPASMLILFAPGGPREEYFEGLAEFQRSGQPTKEDLADFYLRHDNILVEEAG
ncbi:MAG: cupin domain-containing protein [Candidatus Limnocylindrales bacterium]